MPARDALQAELLDAVLELTVVLNADMEQMFAREGLTPSRTHLLWHVHTQGPSTQRALAEALGVAPRSVTGLVDAMVETGFVTREPHPVDRRATLVTLTDRGAATGRALERGHRALAAQLFGDLSQPELARFRRTLAHVVRRLTAVLHTRKDDT